MVVDVGSHGRSWWCVAVLSQKWAKEKLQCIKGWYGSRRRGHDEYDVGFDGVCSRRAIGRWRRMSHGCEFFVLFDDVVRTSETCASVTKYIFSHESGI